MMSTDDQTATGVENSRQDLRLGLAEPQAGEILAGRFLLRSILGSGSTGTVYAAVDATVGQKVAIKLLHPELRDTRTRERLRREVRASRPGHANIVSVFDLHEAGDHVFLSMELVEGRSLRSWLEKEGDLPVDQVIDIGRQTAAALDHLHSTGLVHRDVKPGNILVSSDGTVKLCDMGLARPLEQGVTVTETEMVVGTPNYMAPEQATGADLTSASDIYGLGLTLYQALTGEIPLKEPTAIATLSRRQRERPASIRRRRKDCPHWLDRLIRRMLEPRPRDRLSAGAVSKALVSKRLLPRPRRRTLIWAAAVLIVIAAGISGARLLTRQTINLVEVGKTSITGRDGKGHQTWHREFEIPVLSEQRTDIDGDGIEDILLVLGGRDDTYSRSLTVDGPEIWIFQNDGSFVSHFLPEQEIEWDFDYDVEIQATLQLLDVDHDGEFEAVVVAKHEHHFPAVVFLYRPDSNQWDQVLTHPGNILNIRATPAQADPGFRFVAVNNRLGVLGFLGEIFIREEDGSNLQNARSQLGQQGLQSPPFSAMSPSTRFRWNAYVPMPPNGGGFLSPDAEILDLTDGDLELVSSQGEILKYDRFWNPVPGPNAGRDLNKLRLAFMNEIHYFSPELQMMAPYSISGRRADMLVQFEPLLAEAAYRLILDLKSARALARADRLEEAQDILNQTVLQTRHLDAIYRLAHFDALSNDLTGATDRLIRMMTAPGKYEFGTRAIFDGPHLALRIAIENHDPKTVDMAITWLSAQGGSANKVRVAETLRARTRLWWNQQQPEDLTVTSWSYAPSGEAIACLARWRQGINRADDVAAMDAFITRNPDAVFEGRIARSAALLGAGRTAEALDDLSVLVQQLVFPSKDDFALHQLLDLARAMRIVALQANGQTDRALTEATDLLPTLTPDLLPALLVREVLDGPGRK